MNLNQIIKEYLEQNMTWVDKNTTPFVSIESTTKEHDYVQVVYSVHYKDKQYGSPGNHFTHLKNLEVSIHKNNLIPYIRNNKLIEIGI